MRRRLIAVAAVAVYIGSVLLANWLTTRYGFVPVGFGETATAGTFAAGGALVVRDLVQDAVGRVGVLALIMVAALLSYLIADPFIATASALAFLIAEVLDMTVYTPLRAKARFGDWHWQVAVAAGGVVGAIADTVVFLWVGFGRAAVMPGLPGQLIGKCEVIAVLIVVGVAARGVLRQSLNAEGA